MHVLLFRVYIGDDNINGNNKWSTTMSRRSVATCSTTAYS